MSEEVQEKKEKNEIPINVLQDGHYFTDELFLDDGFILLTQETAVSRPLINALIEWNFRTVHSFGTQQDSYAGLPISMPSSNEPEKEIVIKELEAEFSQSVPPLEEPDVKMIEMSRDEELADIQLTYNEYLIFADQIFKHYANKGILNVEEVTIKARDFCDFVKAHKRLILRVSPSQEVQEKNYLVSHAMKTTVLSIIIGIHLKFPNHRLIELAVSALLHEIGMVRLPSQVYMSNRPLSPQEKKAITAHPVLSYKILHEAGFPLSISLGCLEHHERINGSGYPRNLPGDKISNYAKIISVACSYEAVTSYRPYRTALDAYQGMLEIMKNEGRQYDDNVIRALVYSVSLYPIGLCVLLSSNETAQVIDVNPMNPKYPIVKVLNPKTVGSVSRTIKTSQTGISIVRPLTKEELAVLKPHL